MIAGQGTRPGNAVPTNGGFKLTGSWSFASGIKHGTHIHTLGIIEGTNEARIFVLPVGKAKLIDNWDVMGLRATGSIDYTTDTVFVPEAFTHLATTEQPLRGGHLYSSASSGSRASVIPAGRAASAGACSTSSRPSRRRRRGEPARWPTARASKRTSRTPKAVYRVGARVRLRDVERRRATLDRGDKPAVRQHSLVRLALAHSTWSAHEAATFAYRAGTQACGPGRFSICSATCTRARSTSRRRRRCMPPIGRELAGLAKGKKWLFLNLVDA